MSSIYTATLYKAGFAALFLMGCCANGATIAELAPISDAIVVGSISARFESTEVVSFDVTVERILKGQGVPMVVHVDHPWNRRMLVHPDAPSTVSVRLRGIWFLVRTISSGWDVVPANGPDGFFPNLFWPAAEPLPTKYQHPPGASLNDTLTFEVAAGATVSGNPEVLLDAVHSLNSPAVQTVIADFLNSTNTQIRWAALAAVLERGQGQWIAQLVQSWPAISQDARSKFYVLTALSDSFRSQDPNTIRQVAALAQASTTPAELREAFAKVLLSVHTREALPFFAHLLGSADPADRMKGAFAMASFANGSPTQTPDTVKSLAHLIPAQSAPYQTSETLAHLGFRGPRTPDSEAELVSFWTSWWNDHPELH